MELRPEFAEPGYVRPCQSLSVSAASQQPNKSAIIVLPCGVGKTFTQIYQLCQDVRESTASGVKKMNFLVSAPVREIVQHWKEELLRYTTIDPASVIVVESSVMNVAALKVSGSVRIFIITYPLLRTKSKTPFMNYLRSSLCYIRVVCDECHHVPGEKTMKVLCDMKKKHPSMMWTGLTASPINSADRDCAKMESLIGPQITNVMTWRQMEEQKYIAPLVLKNVFCRFPPSWHHEYERLLHDTSIKDRCTLMRRMEMFNPYKLAYIDHQIRLALAEGHKFILFCDCVQLLRQISEVMQCDYIDGNTDKDVRTRMLNEIREGSRQWILVSRIADTGVNLPNVDFAGQVDALGGSARQKTQRVGRVLRYEVGKQALFIDIVTVHNGCDTKEEEFLVDRDRFLMEQEYDLTREWVTSPSPSRFLGGDVETHLMNLVTSYPELQKKYKEINTEYLEKLKMLRRPMGLNLQQKLITKDRRKAMHRSRMKEYQEVRKRLRRERDEKLRHAKIDVMDMDEDDVDWAVECESEDDVEENDEEDATGASIDIV